jgi:ferredoxin-NADP reductase
VNHRTHLPAETFDAIIAAMSTESPTVKSLLLDYGEAPFRFHPGQWIDLFVEIDGRWQVGGYSMTSSPRQRGCIQLAIKQAVHHPVTRHLHEDARMGDRLRISNGQGQCCFRRGEARQLVLLGAGIGVTPLISIYRHIAEAVPEVGATLVHSVGTPAELLFRAELQMLADRRENLHYHPRVTGEHAGWHGQQGRIDRALLRTLDAGPAAHWFYCGAREFNEAMTALLKGLGVSEGRLHYEKWW